MTNEKITTPTAPQLPPQQENGLAIVSMILGIVSLTGPGLLLGIPAIVTASIALKKNRINRGLSITGLVTGIVSTVVSLLFLAFLAFLVIWSINNPEDFNQQPQQYHQAPEDGEPAFDSSQT